MNSWLSQHFLVYAHRGASAFAPENTVVSFARAAACGAGALETDVRLSADGQFVLLHDADVARTTGGGGQVAEMSLDALRRLDAGYRFVDAHGRSWRGRGARIPTLEEALSATDLPMTLEIKDTRGGVARRLIAELDRLDALGRVSICSHTDWHFLSEIRELAPMLPINTSRAWVVFFSLMVRLGLARHVAWPWDLFQVPLAYRHYPVVTPAFLRAAWCCGKPVHCWTINEVTEMHRLLSLGVDGIMSDYPDRLVAAAGMYEWKQT